jgi:hypothetical protein
MVNISLTLYTKSLFGSILMSPIQMGLLSVNNSVTNISRLGTFNGSRIFLQPLDFPAIETLLTDLLSTC